MQALAYTGMLDGDTVTGPVTARLPGTMSVTVTVAVVVTVLVYGESYYRRGSNTYEGTYDVAGVTVTFWKLEQSAERAEASGILPVRVPVTARAQLLLLHVAAKTPETNMKPAKAEVRYMMVET